MNAASWWTPVPVVVLLDTSLSPIAFRLYAVICSHCRPLRGRVFCWAGATTLAKEVGCSTPTIARAMAALVEKGYVVRVRKQAGKTSETWLADLSGCTPITGDTSTPIAGDAQSRCMEVDGSGAVNGGRSAEPPRDSACPELTFADEQPEQPKQQQKPLSKAYQQFVDWYAQMHERFPNDIPAPAGAEKFQGMFFRVRKLFAADKPFSDYDKLTRGVEVLISRRSCIGSLPGMLNAKKPAILTVLAHAGMGGKVSGKVRWDE
jgi:hypothetical protein